MPSLMTYFDTNVWFITVALQTEPVICAESWQWRRTPHPVLYATPASWLLWRGQSWWRAVCVGKCLHATLEHMPYSVLIRWALGSGEDPVDAWLHLLSAYHRTGYASGRWNYVTSPGWFDATLTACLPRTAASLQQDKMAGNQPSTLTTFLSRYQYFVLFNGCKCVFLRKALAGVPYTSTARTSIAICCGEERN